MSLLCDQVHIRVHEIIFDILAGLKGSVHTLLDVGCHDGVLTAECAENLGINQVFGIEFFDENAEAARRRSITVHTIDLEKDRFPFDDSSMGVVICNQVFEHLKQIYLPLAEIHRVLSKGGILIFSTPNLSSLHCRLMLMLGIQPSVIKVFGPHIRGFAFRELRDLLTFNSLFKVRSVYGAGFYPLPEPIAGLLARFLPSLSYSPVFVLEKTSGCSENWTQFIMKQNHETNYCS